MELAPSIGSLRALRTPATGPVVSPHVATNSAQRPVVQTAAALCCAVAIWIRGCRTSRRFGRHSAVACRGTRPMREVSKALGKKNKLREDLSVLKEESVTAVGGDDLDGSQWYVSEKMEETPPIMGTENLVGLWKALAPERWEKWQQRQNAKKAKPARATVQETASTIAKKRATAKATTAATLQELIPRMLDPTSSYEEHSQCFERALRLLRRSQEKKGKFRTSNLDSGLMAQVLGATAANVDDENLKEFGEVFKDVVPCLTLDDFQDAKLWPALQGHHVVLRAALLQAIAMSAEDRGVNALTAWESCGASADLVVNVCMELLDYLVELNDKVLYDPRPLEPKTMRKNRRTAERGRGTAEIEGRAQVLGYGGYDTMSLKNIRFWTEKDFEEAYEKAGYTMENLPAGVLQTDSSAARFFRFAKVQEAIKRVEAEEQEVMQRTAGVLQELAKAAGRGGLSNHLSPAQSLRVAQNLTGKLGSAAEPVLTVLLEEAEVEPLLHGESLLFPLARDTVDTPAQAETWTLLAEVLVHRWSCLDHIPLAQVMCSLPAELATLPKGLHKALQTVCWDNPGSMARLPPSDVADVLQVWVRHQPLPVALQHLVHSALDHQLHLWDPRCLVNACRLLIFVLSEGEILDAWEQWIEYAQDNTGISEWGRRKEALRETCEWFRASKGDEPEGPIAEKVLGIIVRQLTPSASEVPLDLLLDMLAIPIIDTEVRSFLVQELELRVRGSLRGDRKRLPLVTALAIANGETPVPCEPGSLLWGGLVAAISAQLVTQPKVDLFGRYRPRPELWEAVAQHMGKGWRRLELQLMWSGQGPPVEAEEAFQLREADFEEDVDFLPPS